MILIENLRTIVDKNLEIKLYRKLLMTNLMLKLRKIIKINFVNEKFRSVLALCDISQTIVVSIFYLVNDSHIKIGPSGHFSFIIIDYCSLIEFVRIKNQF